MKKLISTVAMLLCVTTTNANDYTLKGPSIASQAIAGFQAGQVIAQNRANMLAQEQEMQIKALEIQIATLKAKEQEMKIKILEMQIEANKKK